MFSPWHPIVEDYHRSTMIQYDLRPSIPRQTQVLYAHPTTIQDPWWLISNPILWQDNLPNKMSTSMDCCALYCLCRWWNWFHCCSATLAVQHPTLPTYVLSNDTPLRWTWLDVGQWWKPNRLKGLLQLLARFVFSPMLHRIRNIDR